MLPQGLTLLFSLSLSLFGSKIRVFLETSNILFPLLIIPQCIFSECIFMYNLLTMKKTLEIHRKLFSSSYIAWKLINHVSIGTKIIVRQRKCSPPLGKFLCNLSKRVNLWYFRQKRVLYSLSLPVFFGKARSDLSPFSRYSDNRRLRYIIYSSLSSLTLLGASRRCGFFFRYRVRGIDFR